MQYPAPRRQLAAVPEMAGIRSDLPLATSSVANRLMSTSTRVNWRSSAQLSRQSSRPVYGVPKLALTRRPFPKTQWERHVFGTLGPEQGTLGYVSSVRARLRRSATSRRPNRPHLNAPDGRLPLPFRSQNRTAETRELLIAVTYVSQQRRGPHA